jgi:hypothetical protein
VAYLDYPVTSGSLTGIDTVQTIEQLRQIFDTTYLNRSTGIPVNSIMGISGSLDRSTTFSTFNLGEQPRAESKQLDTFSLSRNNRQSGLIGQLVFANFLRCYEWDE